MGVLDDVLSSAKTAATYAGKKTGEIFEISQQKIKGLQVSSEINRTYEKLGRTVYELIKESSDDTELINKIADEIDLLMLELDTINDKINELKNLKKCHKCSHGNPTDAIFCIKCGERL